MAHLFGQVLRWARLRANIGAPTLAARLGVSSEAIYRREQTGDEFAATIRAIMDTAGQGRLRAKRKLADVAARQYEIRRLSRTGLTYAVIAERLECTPRQVAYAMRTGKTKRPGRGAPGRPRRRKD